MKVSKIVAYIYLEFSLVLRAVIITLILGWSLKTLAIVWLILALGIFSIPLLITGALGYYPWWVYYIFILSWIDDMLFHKKIEEEIK